MSGIRRPRLVVVTGAGSGIGRATALAFAARGAQVVCVDLDLASAERTASACGRGQGLARACDVAEAPAVVALANEIEAGLGAVDVLVNNAGVGLGGDFLDADLDDWAWIRSVNLDGVVHGCHAFGRHLVARGRGQVVNVASGLAFVPSRRTAAYCATKAGVRMLSESLRADWSRHGVGVSVVCPGVIDTPILAATRLRGAAEGQRSALSRVFRHGHAPERVAEAIVRAARDDRALVPVGWEAHLGLHATRLLPTPLRILGGRL
ncbi:SDR family NAD(P)-dependent oxidoreductase [Nocardioides sp. TRM66260-LWL]|uniref:SDR family NAD(P)-dependent oxidoreductase n=1 Tax=Nocardioides sp. TRM66260-LWL TaxID=2874478 RepID=UPI001CC8172B|nr:SDR family NAD(P)-dependent oxidoreductase [Nocardioides sp. TRM66260-LWL]MBZ5734105.1 SDR family NAD(P)-dependent oxidoreductase [Nocardioides sp. TRM66260-LWL]